MKLRHDMLPDLGHLGISISGILDLHGGEEKSWLVPVVRFDAPVGFGEATWLAARQETVLAFGLLDNPVQWCGGRHADRVSRPSANLALQPKGVPVRFRAEGPARCAQFYFSEALLDRAAAAAGVAPLSGRLRDDLVFVPDPLLHERLASHVRRAFDAKDPPSALEMEGRSLLVLDRLVALHSGRARANLRGGLAPLQLRRTTEYIAARLAEDVSLAELAMLAKLSPFHFARAFRVSTGLPPHRYQIVLRIKRARDMLLNSSLPVAEIAATVGYDNPAYFSRLFARETGCPPSAWRRTAN